jgi:DNA-binding NtrC family response regulator
VNADGQAPGPAGRVLIVEDERLIRWSLRTALEAEGLEIVEAATVADGRAALAAADPDAVLCDVRLPDGSGLDVVRQVAADSPDVPVLVVTAYGSVEDAVAAMKAGAYDYLTKPVEPAVLLPLVRRALERTELRREIRRLRAEQARTVGSPVIVGRGPAVTALLATIDKIGRGDATTVLLQGESGTGKGLVARVLHDRSRRRNGPFVPVVCAAIPETLFESELFGHERGAFTDARARKQGLVELADGGTLFLDEIAEVPPVVQAKLLGFLEERTIRRVGGTADIPVNVRVVAASNRDLAAEVRGGRFREDLWFRLQVIPLRLPPLRERREDIPLLAEHFLERLGTELGAQRPELASDAAAALRDYAWPGNVRELRNVLERALLLGSGRRVELDDLPAEVRQAGGAAPDGRRLLRLPIEGLDFEALERDLVVQALELAGGNQTQAARLLAMNRDQIRYRIKKFNLDEGAPEDAQEPAASAGDAAISDAPLPSRSPGSAI